MIFFLASLTTYFCYLILKYQRHIELLNKNKFNIIKTYNQTIKKNFITLDIIGIVPIVLALSTNVKIAGISMVVVYTLLFLNELKKFQKRIKLNSNAALMIIFTFIIYSLVFTWIALDPLKSSHTWIYYIILVFMAYISPFISLFVGLCTSEIKKLSHKKNKGK